MSEKPREVRIVGGTTSIVTALMLFYLVVVLWQAVGSYDPAPLNHACRGHGGIQQVATHWQPVPHDVVVCRNGWAVAP